MTGAKTAKVQRVREAAKASHEQGGGLDFLHSVLDVAGMLPVVGTAADLANAGLYVAQGDFGNAGLSAMSAIPLVGDALGAGKLALKYGDDAIAAVEFVAQLACRLAVFASFGKNTQYAE